MNQPTFWLYAPLKWRIVLYTPDHKSSLGELLRKKNQKSWKHVFYTNWTILSRKPTNHFLRKMTKSGVVTEEKKSKIVKTCFLHELNDSESKKIFFEKIFLTPITSKNMIFRPKNREKMAKSEIFVEKFFLNDPKSRKSPIY